MRIRSVIESCPPELLCDVMLGAMDASVPEQIVLLQAVDLLARYRAALVILQRQLLLLRTSDRVGALTEGLEAKQQRRAALRGDCPHWSTIALSPPPATRAASPLPPFYLPSSTMQLPLLSPSTHPHASCTSPICTLLLLNAAELLSAHDYSCAGKLKQLEKELEVDNAGESEGEGEDELSADQLESRIRLAFMSPEGKPAHASLQQADSHRNPSKHKAKQRQRLLTSTNGRTQPRKHVSAK